MKLNLTLQSLGSALLVASISACGGGGGGGDSAGGSSTTPTATDPATTTTVQPAAQPTATTPAATPQADTSVLLSGSLNLAGSSSSSASLALANTSEAYYMKAVTLSLTDLTSCVAEVGADGSWQMDCEGFKGKRLGIFVLKGTSGNAEAADLEIVAMINSNDLALNDESTDAEMKIELDEQTGAASIDVTQKKVERDEAGNVLAEVAKAAGPIEVPAELAAFNIASGNYEFRFCDADRTRAAKGDFRINNCDVDAADFHGHRENMYIDFTTAPAGGFPQIALWRSQADRDKCYVNDTLSYHISDGVNSPLVITPESDFITVYDTIIANGWVSQISIDTTEVLSQIEDASSADRAAEEGEFFKAVFNVTDQNEVCTVFMAAAKTAYDGATLKKGSCDPSSIAVSGFEGEVTGPDGNPAPRNEAIANMLRGNDGPPIEWCSEYREEAAEGNGDAAIARFTEECNLHMSGDAKGEEVWQRRDVVDSFFRFLSESRHEGGGDNRFAGFKEAYAAIDFNNVSGNSDGDLKALATSWREVSWDHQVNQALDVVLANADEFNTVVPGLQFQNEGVDISPKSFLVKILELTGNGSPRSQIEELACEGSGRLDLVPLNLLDATNPGRVFLDKVEQSDHQWAVKSSESDDAETIITNFINDVTGGADGTDASKQLVSGCTAIQLKRERDHLANSGGGFFGGGQDDPSRHILNNLAWSLSDSYRGKVIGSINLGDPDGDNVRGALAGASAADVTDDKDALLAKAKQLFEMQPEHSAWMFTEGICKVDTAYSTTISGAAIDCDMTEAEIASLPQNLQHIFRQGGHGGENDWTPADDTEALRHLTHMLSGMLIHEAARYDEGFRDVKRAITANSNCLPDVRVSHDVERSGDGSDLDHFKFGLNINGPVKRRMNAEVDLAVSFDTADTSVKFAAEDSRLEKHEDLARTCVWGEVQRLDKMVLDGADLKGSFSQAWINQCTENSSGEGEDDSSSSEESADDSSQENNNDHGWHAIFRAKPVAN